MTTMSTATDTSAGCKKVLAHAIARGVVMQRVSDARPSAAGRDSTRAKTADEKRPSTDPPRHVTNTYSPYENTQYSAPLSPPLLDIKRCLASPWARSGRAACVGRTPAVPWPGWKAPAAPVAGPLPPSAQGTQSESHRTAHIHTPHNTRLTQDHCRTDWVLPLWSTAEGLTCSCCVSVCPSTCA
jgi:hypothetical protein